MDAFINTINALSRLFGIAAVLLLAAGMLVTCEQVFMRYVLKASTIWQTEFVTYSVVAATFLGSPYVLMRRGHVNVDLIPLYLPHKARMILAVAAALAALAFCLALTWATFHFWQAAWAQGQRSQTVWGPPLWIVYLPMLVGMVLLCLQYLAEILALLSGRELPFGLRPEERP
jgi:TRAP-type C4-dicarboxylate transport system permease small subunit